MIPLVAAGIGILVGGAIIEVFRGGEVNDLKDALADAERSHAALEAQLRAATDREVKHRKEHLRLTLELSQARMKVLFHQPDAPMSRLERVYAVGKALQKLVSTLPADGLLPPTDLLFVNLVNRGMNGEKLKKSEQALVEEYLDEHVGEQRRDFLENQLSTAFKRLTKKLQSLRAESDAKELELDTLQLRRKVEGLSAAQLEAVRGRLNQINLEIKTVEQRLHDVERSLVVLARVSRPDVEQEPADRAALEIVQRAAQGTPLSDEEATFLQRYRERYFLSARQILRDRRNIDLAFQEAS